MERRDQGLLHPLLEVPRLTCHSWEANRGLRSGRQVGSALVLASEAKIEIEVKILIRLEAKNGMILLVSHKNNNNKKSEAK